MKTSKKLIAPLVSILAFGALGVGSTYALFTSQTETNIAVTAGNVKVSAATGDLVAYSADSTLTSGDLVPDTSDLGEFSGTYYFHQVENTNEGKKATFLNGGTVEVDDNGNVTLDKMSPGDKVTFNITVTNESNISIKVREIVKLSFDTGLFDALEINVGGVDFAGYKTSTWKEWENYAVQTTDTNKVISVSVYLPMTAGDVYQESECTIHFGIEAAQGNAYTTEDSWLKVANEMLDKSSQTNLYPTAAINEAVEKTGASYNDIFVARSDSKVYAWDSQNDQFVVDNITAFNSNKYYVFTDALADFTGVNYSAYLINNSNSYSSIETDKGLDVGNVEDIVSINFTNSSATEDTVSIYTNSSSTTLNINAPKYTVNHFGVVGAVIIGAVNRCSYHEYGNTNYILNSCGRVVAETGGTIDTVVIQKGTDDNNPAVIQNNGGVIENAYASTKAVAITNNSDAKNVQLDEGYYKAVTNPGDILTEGGFATVAAEDAAIDAETLELFRSTATDASVVFESNKAVCCRIGTTGYETLNAALNAVATDGEIVMITNAQLKANMGIQYVTYKDWTLDLNNHTLNNTCSNGIWLYTDHNLTFKNGDVTGYLPLVSVFSDSSVTLINMDNASELADDMGGTITIQ